MKAAEDPISRLLSIMARLRDDKNGCPWDVGQSFFTIAPYTIEEAYEVADAIAREDMTALQDELGDLLFQVVFHAQMAKELGHFAFDDVVKSINDKMIRRHPHVFSDAEKPDWETLKAAERANQGNGNDISALAGVALALPALMRAEKLQKRAARTGFDWPDESGALAKVFEEIEEVQSAETPDAKTEEFGDLIFAVVNWARKSGIDPENALRAANGKFEKRFRIIEQQPDFEEMPLKDKEALWVQAKKRLS